MGFVLNPCDQRVASKMIDGKQHAICWFVDDLKISHMKVQVAKDITSTIEERHGKMVVTHGVKHTRVGVDIEHAEKGEAKILMIECLKEAIKAFPEDCSKPIKTPAASHIFEANENCPKLKESDRSKEPVHQHHC